jgi:hypothetical protein
MSKRTRIATTIHFLFCIAITSIFAELTWRLIDRFQPDLLNQRPIAVYAITTLGGIVGFALARRT